MEKAFAIDPALLEDQGKVKGCLWQPQSSQQKLYGPSGMGWVSDEKDSLPAF